MALLQVSFFSNTLGMSMQMNVILPQQDHNEKIPVLYLLHGMSDDHTAWIKNTAIERYVSDRNLAVIMPSTHLGWYTDMAHGNKYWTFISEELPKITQSFFKHLSDQREDNFVAGLSMGGYGALKMGLKASKGFQPLPHYPEPWMFLRFVYITKTPRKRSFGPMSSVMRNMSGAVIMIF
jgi:putative tributyrin esterase